MANLRPCPAIIDGEWEPDCDNCSQLITYIKTLCDDKGDDEREKTLNEAMDFIKDMESVAVEASIPDHEPDRYFH